MDDNRFKDYPTKRIPKVGKGTRAEAHSDYDIDDEYLSDDEQYDGDYDDDSYDTDYDTKPVPSRRASDRTKERDPLPVRRNSERRTDRTITRSRAGARHAHSYNERQHRSGRNIREKSKSAFVAVYIGLLFVAVAVSITAFVLIFQRIMDESPDLSDIIGDRDRPSISNGNNGDENGETQTPIGRPDIQNFRAMVTGIDISAPSLALLDIDTMQASEILLADDVEIFNRSGASINLSQIRIGQIMYIDYDARFPQITTIRENARAVEFRERRNVIINQDNNTITIGHEAFMYTSQTLVMHRGNRINISEISPADSVTVMTFDQRAWKIELDSSTGRLRPDNAGHITNGRITIGNQHALFLDELSEPIIVPEGPHTVLIEGDNIAPFTTTVVITHGQTIGLDLSGIQLTHATLVITTTPANAAVYVNDNRITSPTTQVEFGSHRVRVQHYGFITEERTVAVDESVTAIRIDLIEEIVTPEVANIVVFTTPSNAQIFVNNLPVGRANPSLVLELEPGTHSIIARLPGYTDTVHAATVTSGQNMTINMTLLPIIPDDPSPPTSNNQGDGEEDEPGQPLPPPPLLP